MDLTAWGHVDRISFTRRWSGSTIGVVEKIEEGFIFKDRSPDGIGLGELRAIIECWEMLLLVFQATGGTFNGRPA